MSNKILNAAVVGCGAIAPMHINSLLDFSDRKLYAVADIIKERADDFSRRFNCKAYYSFDDVLEDDNIDVIHICTPHFLHAEMIIRGLRAGKHVLCEKPLAISFSQAEEILKAAESCQRIAGICFQNRYKETSRKVKELLSSGRVGKVLGAKAFVTWHRDRNYYASSPWRGKWATEGGGVLINQAIHTIDLLRWFLGDVDRVEGTISTRLINDVIEVENSAEALISFKSGVNALLYATSCYCVDSPVVIEIFCESARIFMDDSLTVTFSDGSKEFYHEVDINTGCKLCWGDYHCRLIDEFYNCIASGRPFPVSLEEGYKTLKIVLDIYKSNGL